MAKGLTPRQGLPVKPGAHQFRMSRDRSTPGHLLSRLLLCVAAGLSAAPAVAAADEPCIAVFYPEVRRPYRTVLEDIMTGIERGARWPVRRYPIPETSRKGAAAAPAASPCAAAIGLGRGGLRVVSAMDRPAVVGAVFVQPGDIKAMPGISLVPDPAELFKRLKHFVPEAETVYVIFNPEHTAQLVADAGRAARRMELKLVAVEAYDLRSALLAYKKILAAMDPERSALWLLQDPSIMDANTILPLVLTQAWKRRLVVFSSQAAHVKNGVLFSVYPNNRHLGRRLGEIAQECAEQGCPGLKVALLRDLRTAINTRTAARLNVNIDPRHDLYVDLVFPRR